MNAKIRYTALAILVIGILVSLVLTTSSPLLYTLEDDTFSSPFHKNVDVLKQQSLNSTTDVLPEIQDFIDFTGPLSVSIRIHDIEQARRDLERFQNSHGSLKNLIVKLDMNESEIQKIEENTALQKEMLDSLLNTSISLDELQVMEIQYNDENNQDMLTTIRLKGDELRKKVKGMSARYRNATEKVTESGNKIGLNMTKNQESQEYVDQIIAQIEKPQATTPVDTSLIPGDDRVSLFIQPDTGKYRETIEYMGISLTLKGNTTLREGGKQIILYLDDTPVSTVMTDSFGYYSIRIPIEHTLAGKHIAYVRSPTSRSVNRTLTVLQVDSITNLTVSRPDKDSTVNCTGVVMANYPVRSATIQITWDQTHVLVTKTDSRGWFMKEIQLPPGKHTLVAQFSGESYPINPSESDPQVVEISLIPQSGDEFNLWNLILTIFAVVIIVVFAGAAIFYLKRMTRKHLPVSDISSDTDDENKTGSSGDSDIHAPAMDTSELFDADNETLLAYYRRLLKEKGLNTASWRVYQHLSGRVARDLNIKRHKALTAREISRTCKGRSYCKPLARLISAYERIRYGGEITVKDQTVFETALHSTDDKMEGKDH